MTLSICIATHRRADRLALLLTDLCTQDAAIDEVIVVDNDVGGSARAVVDAQRAAGTPFVLQYAIQPERNIALTRNRTVELASGDWVAFIDDDERAPPSWLRQLLEAAEHHAADGVLGPVVPEVPPTAPSWIRRGRFYDFPRMRTGEAVPLNRMRFGNLVLRGARLRAEAGPFDVRYGLGGGEDGDLLIRLVAHGARIIWCDEAIVYEPIEAGRLSLRWLLMRAIGGGQEFARKTLAGRYGKVNAASHLVFAARAVAQLLLAAALAVASLPFGRHRAAAWLVRAAANLGKISVLWGWRYQEYA